MLTGDAHAKFTKKLPICSKVSLTFPTSRPLFWYGLTLSPSRIMNVAKLWLPVFTLSNYWVLSLSSSSPLLSSSTPLFHPSYLHFLSLSLFLSFSFSLIFSLTLSGSPQLNFDIILSCVCPSNRCLFLPPAPLSLRLFLCLSQLSLSVYSMFISSSLLISPTPHICLTLSFILPPLSK